jgi:hypothetical protein
MQPEALARCLEEAFGNLEQPSLEEMAAPDTYIDQSFVDGVKSHAWQNLRPLKTHLGDASEVVLLSAKAYRYYLPAYLYALIDKEGDEFYLDGILDSLWYEGLYFDMPRSRELWEERMALLTDQQKRCIAHLLVHILRRTSDRFLEEGSNTRRIESMLKKYWNARL